MEDTERIKRSQDEILSALRAVLPPTAVLTGGTALTRFYGFDHRFSEDLDIFGYAFSQSEVEGWLKSLALKAFQVELLTVRKAPVFHLESLVGPPDGEAIRLDFVEDVFSGCWLPQKAKTVDTGIEFMVDSLEAILHKKLYAVYSMLERDMEARPKDLLDLFILFRDRFVFDQVRNFYKDARDIHLPIDMVIKAVASARPDFSGLKGLKPGLEEAFRKWQTEI